jgi:hypothetical protein
MPPCNAALVAIAPQTHGGGAGEEYIDLILACRVVESISTNMPDEADTPNKKDVRCRV